MIQTVVGKSMTEKPVLPNALLATLFIIFAEIMVFAGLISAFFVVGQQMSAWPPVGQPRLPLAFSLFNSLIMLGSGFFIWQGFLSEQKKQHEKFVKMWRIGTLLGLSFLFNQGIEWVRLLVYGFTTPGQIFTSFFYLIIGFHALHAGIGAFLLLLIAFKRRLHLESVVYFWTFVVGLWPILFFLVYGA